MEPWDVVAFPWADGMSDYCNETVLVTLHDLNKKMRYMTKTVLM
jgi:ABC-type cobalamin/Fe3+-siderophores transport system ATPase subunit